MRIAIDARLNAYRQGGISQYTRQLMTALAEVAHDDTIISLQHHDHLRPLVVAPNVRRRTVFTPPHHRLEQWTLPLETMLARPDVLHCPDFIAPIHRTTPAVVTIHDLAFLHYPQILDDAARAFYSRVKASALRANAVIAVSEATRQDIAQLLDIPIEQIDVIHEAAAPVYGRIDLRPGEVRVLDGTPVAAGTFMLFVSTLEPRKNLPTLLRALRICLDRAPAAAYRLVVAGSRGWRDEEIFTTVRDLRLEEHVVFARRVGQYDLRWLYNACRLYVNPSLYEGFGLPLLEAMACGAPSLAAATSSLPEIGGEAAIYVPPLDAGAWADTIAELWDDEERRAELGRRGRVQAQRFSWVRAARETLAVYRRAAEGRDLSRVAAHPAAQQPDAQPATSAATHCPRCGAPLAEGRLTGEAAVQLADEAAPPLALDPDAQVCPSCGRVQLQARAQQAAPLPELRLPPPEAAPSPELAAALPAGDAVASAEDHAPAALPAGDAVASAEDHAPAGASAAPSGDDTPTPDAEAPTHEAPWTSSNGVEMPMPRAEAPTLEAPQPPADDVEAPAPAEQEAVGAPSPQAAPPEIAPLAAPQSDDGAPHDRGRAPLPGEDGQAHAADEPPLREEPVVEQAAPVVAPPRTSRSSRRKRSRQS